MKLFLQIEENCLGSLGTWEMSVDAADPDTQRGWRWGAGEIGTSHRFFQVTCLSSVKIPGQIAIHLALWKADPFITPALTLFYWHNQPLAGNFLPGLVSWLLTWSIFLLTSESHAFGVWQNLLCVLQRKLTADSLSFEIAQTHLCNLSSANLMRTG